MISTTCFMNSIPSIFRSNMSAQPPPNPGATAAATKGISAPTTTQQRQRPHPLPTEFSTDPRVHFDKAVGKWQYEDDVTHQEFEWNEPGQTWVPVVRADKGKANASTDRVPALGLR